RWLGVEMAAHAYGCKAIDPPGSAGKHVANIIARDRAADRFRRRFEPITNLLVFIGKRQTAYTALRSTAEFCGFHERAPKAPGIDLEVLHSSPPHQIQ